MKTAPNKLVSVIWDGFTITEIESFRSGEVKNGQHFFELKIKQPPNGSPFKPGIDDPDSFKERPITLNFLEYFGQVKPVIANIIKVDYTNDPSQSRQIIIGGTMYQPSGTLSKFSLIAIGLVMLPVLFVAILSLCANSLQHKLIPVNGKVTYFKDDSYKRFKKYTFKISPFKATLYREYDRPLFDESARNIDELFMSDYDGFHKDSIGQHVRFYLFSSDSSKLNTAGEKVTFFDLKRVDGSPVKQNHFWDMWNYITNKSWIYFAWLALLVAQLVCYCSAYYFYKMYALFHVQRNKVLWWSSITLSSVLNLIIIMTVA
ncbi:hypothetical protein [Mucilaginibacter terrae]|uniref:DUF3592 domain-containing protein n=1 Tax=Mucilaginibacter terrae TaxID=1955052 RepID=A0ABU3H0R3_9SPHI|nr:hypothetical protein [Mucilaginibacter terrae]MDT3405276.1 hypothetical protein [Mucilaginibacter terrae]